MAKNQFIADVTKHFAKMQNIFLNQLLPPRCLSCGVGVQDTGRICADCWKALVFLQGPACGCCGYPFDFDPTGEESSDQEGYFLCGACQITRPVFDQASAALRYDDNSRKMIIAFKHSDRTDYASFFSQLLIQASYSIRNDQHPLGRTAIVVPVPLHKRRLKKRRYNQAALIAKNFARMKGLDYSADMLIRQKYTPPQGGNYNSRKQNVTGAFRLKNSYQDMLKGQDIILIDDVYTTGATVSACAYILKQAGAVQVTILTIARVCRSSGQ